MTEDEKREFLECIEKTIEKKVNGRIESLHSKVDAHNERHEQDMVEVKDHIKKVEPFLQGVAGAKLLGDAGKWLVGLGVIWLAIKGVLPTIK